MSYRHRLLVLKHCEQRHSAAMHRMREWQLMAHTPGVAPIQELAMLQAGGAGAAEALQKLKAAQRKLAQAMVPEAVTECERTAKRVLSAAEACEAELIRQEEAEQRAALVAAAVRVELLRRLPSDRLSEACASLSKRTRNRTTNQQHCLRRAACVGTSAPAAPPAAVGNKQTTAQLCADQSGASQPM